MKVYIAGPMSKYPNYNFDAFDLAAQSLRDRGYIPVSPADIDRVFEGWGQYPPEGAVFGKDEQKRFMLRDVVALMECDAIYMLNGWEQSKGALVEKAVAEFMGLAVIYETR